MKNIEYISPRTEKMQGLLKSVEVVSQDIYLLTEKQSDMDLNYHLAPMLILTSKIISKE